MSFPHLHVASGYSLRYGASSPTAFVEAAAAQGMDTLALTDRDGLYGAVKFVLACRSAGIAPVLGADLAVEPSGLLAGLPAWADPAAAAARRRTPVRGGSTVDPRRPRVTVLALAPDPSAGRQPGAGWTALCRLVSGTHLRGERGEPVADPPAIGEHARTAPGGPAALAVLLGPDSEVGRAVLARRPDVARAVLARWAAALPAGSLAVEVVCHYGRHGGPASVGHAARMLELARAAGVPAVLTNAVRYVEPGGAATADVLDAARRLVPLDARHLDRVTAQGHLAGADHMTRVAREVARAAGDEAWAADLLAATHALAARCRLDPRADLGIDSVHLPENHVLGLGETEDADARLRKHCESQLDRCYPGASASRLHTVLQRLDDELHTIARLGFASYFLTVEEVCRLTHEIGVRVAARGSGAGSLVNHLLKISGVDPIRYDLLMERFLTPLRIALPDIDIDVESARRTEVYEAILARFGSDRVACVSMMDTYRVRHAIRDVGAALGLPPGEIDVIAKSFPHIRARDVRHALVELPELRASGIASERLEVLFDLVERLDGLPRHVALHPCGVLISDATLLDRTPVEASWQGFPMSQFDKDDVEQMGLLKLDVLGIRMQSAMAYALDEVARVDGADAARAGGHDPSAPYLDEASGRIDLDAVPHDDEATFRLVRTTHTLGCFQIESPGQRELVGKFGPETFLDLVIDISLFRPGPVKSDMITPFLRTRQGWDAPDVLHPRLERALGPTGGVVVFHEQVLLIIQEMTGCGLAQADEVRRTLGSREGQAEVEQWFRPVARQQGFDDPTVDRVWEVLKAFASFGFCKAHAAAFALPTYHSAWLKAHHPAAFLAGVLTHDPGMYPKRLLLDDARGLGIAVLPLDVDRSGSTYLVEKVTWWDEPPPRILDQLDQLPPDRCDDAAGAPTPRARPHPDLPDGRAYGIRLSLTDVKGITDAEVERIIAGRPYHSLADFWHRAGVSRPVVERLVVAGGFDTLYGLGSPAPVRRRGRVTRRDRLLQVAELDRWSRAATRGRTVRGGGAAATGVLAPAGPAGPAGPGLAGLAGPEGGDLPPDAVRAAAARQSQAPRTATPARLQAVQLALDLGDAPDETVAAGLAEMTGAERVRAELEVLGLDASRHVLDFYEPLLAGLGVTRAHELLQRRSRSELLVAGVKVATQTPPIRSGRRVVFLTLDDATGPLDATFFEDVQGPYAATVFHSWLLLVRGVLRRTGPRGVGLRATGAWELPVLWDAWTAGGTDAVGEILATAPGWAGAGAGAVSGAAASRSSRPVLARPPVSEWGSSLAAPADAQDEAARTGLPVGDRDPDGSGRGRAGGMGGGPVYRRVFIDYATGYRQSPWADVAPPGDQTRDTRRMAAAETSQDRADQRGATRRETHPDAPQGPGRRGDPPRKLWHASPGSSGR